MVTIMKRTSGYETKVPSCINTYVLLPEHYIMKHVRPSAQVPALHQTSPPHILISAIKATLSEVLRHPLPAALRTNGAKPLSTTMAPAKSTNARISGRRSDNITWGNCCEACAPTGIDESVCLEGGAFQRNAELLIRTHTYAYIHAYVHLCVGLVQVGDHVQAFIVCTDMTAYIHEYVANPKSLGRGLHKSRSAPNAHHIRRRS